MNHPILAELDAGKTALKPLYCPALQKRRKSGIAMPLKLKKDEIGIARRVNHRIQNSIVPGLTVPMPGTEIIQSP